MISEVVNNPASVLPFFPSQTDTGRESLEFKALDDGGVDETRRDASRSSVAAAKPEPQLGLCMHGIASEQPRLIWHMQAVQNERLSSNRHNPQWLELVF
jgi:hypothetical protein